MRCLDRGGDGAVASQAEPSRCSPAAGPNRPMRHAFRRTVFVHVPKTAGTTLRSEMGKRFQEDMILDYGLASAATSPVVRQHLEAGDRAGLCAALARRERFLLFGHIRAANYRDLLPFADFVTFLRDPFDRAVSEFGHFVRYYGYDRPFRQFIDGPHFRNRQSALVEGIAVKDYSFIGFQESYDEDVRRLAPDMRFGPQRQNVGDYARVDKNELWEKHGAHFQSVNARDYALLARARAIHRSSGTVGGS
jgi:hypothetical protein